MDVDKQELTTVIIRFVVAVLLIIGALFFINRGFGTQGDAIEPSGGEVQSASTLVVAHSFDDGTHSYGISFEKPTPCHTLETQVAVAESFPEQISIDIIVSEPKSGVACIQVIDREFLDIAVDASEGATLMNVLVNGELVPFEIFEEAKG